MKRCKDYDYSLQNERNTTPIIQEKEKKKTELENTISVLTEERVNAEVINMKILFNGQYLKACSEHKLLEKELEDLLEKEGNFSDSIN